MQLVSSEWLHERGGLHDARVLDVRWTGAHLELSLDDSWSNERELSLPAGADPGTLVLEDAQLEEGDLSAATNGWVSEITIAGSRVSLLFFYQPPLRFSVSRLQWRSAE